MENAVVVVAAVCRAHPRDVDVPSAQQTGVYSSRALDAHASTDRVWVHASTFDSVALMHNHGVGADVAEGAMEASRRFFSMDPKSKSRVASDGAGDGGGGDHRRPSCRRFSRARFYNAW